MSTPTPETIVEGNPLATTIVAILHEAPSPHWTAMAAHLTEMLLPKWANAIFSTGPVCLDPDPDNMRELFTIAGWDVNGGEVQTKITERYTMELGFDTAALKRVIALAPPSEAVKERFMRAFVCMGEDALIAYTDTRRCVSYTAPNRKAGPYWLTACRIHGQADMVSATGDTEHKAAERLERMVREYSIEMVMAKLTARENG